MRLPGGLLFFLETQGDGALAKNQNTFEKRRREMEKKRKAEEKRERRRNKKSQPDAQDQADVPDPNNEG